MCLTRHHNLMIMMMVVMMMNLIVVVVATYFVHTCCDIIKHRIHMQSTMLQGFIARLYNNTQKYYIFSYIMCFNLCFAIL